MYGEVVHSLRQLANTEIPMEVKTNLKDPSGKPTENFLQFTINYTKPNLDPDEELGMADTTKEEKSTKKSKKG